MLESGYRMLTGNVINTIVQGMTKFGAIRDKFEIDVSDMYVLETKE